MIPNILFIALRYFFLLLLYVFLLIVVRAIYRDIKVPEVAPKQARRRKKEKPQLVVLAADRNIGARYRLDDTAVLGRAEECGILMDDTYASQQHARVFPDSGSFFVEDMGSTNGTYLNGRKITHPVELRPGDRIKIGKTVFEFRC